MTERKTPDSELFKEKENGLYFRAIFDSQSDAISITQISNGSFKYINKAFVNFTGYTQKELIGKNTSSINLFVHPEDAIKLNEEFLVKGNVTNFESKMRLKNGAIKTVLTSLTSFKYKREKFIITTSQDITQSKIIDKTLRFVSGGWREKGTDFNNSIISFLTEVLDIEFAFIDELLKNNRVKTLCLTQKNETLPNIEYPLNNTPCQNVIVGKYCLYTSNIQQLFPNDEVLVGMNAESYAAIPLWDSKGEIIGILGVIGIQPIKNAELIKTVLNLTAARVSHQIEQDKNAEKLKLNISNLEKAQQIAKIGNWELDYIHDKLTWSNEIFNILEINSESYKPSSKTTFQFVHPEDREMVKNTFETSKKENKDYSIVFRMLLKNNHIKWVIQKGTREYNSERIPIRTIGSLQDITELKLAELELKKTQEKFKTIVENTSEWIWEMDLNGVHTYSNPVIENILGYAPSEIVGKHSFDLIHPMDVAKITENLPTFISTKKGWENWEIKWIHKDGSYRYLESNSIPILNDNGELKGFRGVDRDITQRKNTEKEALKLSTIVEQSANTIVITDLNGNIEYTNPKFTEVTGYTAAEALGQNPRILNSSLQPKIFYKQLWETIKAGNIWKGEFQNKTKKGKLFWEQTTISPIKDKNGDIINFVAIKEDITKLKENEQILKTQNEELHLIGNQLSEQNRLLLESKNRFSNLFEKSPVSLWEEDFSEVKLLLEKKSKQVPNLKLFLDENPDFVYECASKVKVLNVNNVTLDLLGVASKKDLNYLSKSFNENSFNTFKDELVSFTSNENEFIRETEIVRGDRSVISVIVKSVLLEDGKTVLVSMVNITDIKNAEKKLKRQNKKLKTAKEKSEESNKLKTEFLNNMSHEIRTPMNGILGFAEILKLPDLSLEKQKNYINIIQNSGDQLLRVIDDIIEISRLGTKQVQIIEKEVCLNNLMLALFSIFQITSKENNLPLYFKKGLPDTESTIFTDASKLNKILSNLLENAFKFTHIGSIDFGYNLNGNFLDIFVKDTGVGINTEKQKTIFDRFSQVEKELSQKFGGLGLGLSIAKENALLLGGKITVTSEKGVGSTFTLSIPYKPSIINLTNQKEIMNMQKTPKKKLILIVEDEEVNYLFIEILLTDVLNIDCDLLHAKNGKEAVEICRDNAAVDLVLMDIKMPVMNGYDATILIKEFNPNLVIVAQTAYTTIEDKAKAFAVGCNDFISKPVTKTVLSPILTKYLNIEIS